MRFVLRCALGAVVVAGVTLAAACQSSSTSASAPSRAPTPTTVALPATTTTSTTVPTTTPPASKPITDTARIYLVDVNKQKSITPNSILLSGDSTLYVDKVKWASWTTTGATGSGVILIDDCVPDCARGHQSRYPVAIHLTRPVTASCGQAWSAEAFDFTGPVPGETPPFLHRNGPAEWGLAPLLEGNRC